MALSVRDALVLHSAVVIALLSVAAWLLWRRDLFHFRSAGFWAWCGLLVYLVLPPLLSVIQGALIDYNYTLGLSGGADRALWITSVAALGISFYFAVYLRTRPAHPRWMLRSQDAAARFTGPQVVVLGLAIVFGLWSLITFRSGLIQESGAVFVNGRLVGSATGYQYTAHILLFFPIALFVLHSSGRLRLLGYVLAAIYVVVGSLDPYARFLQVSVLLIVAVATICRTEGRRWPNPFLAAAVAGLALLLGARGHTTFTSLAGLFSIAQQTPANVTQQFTGPDANLLSNWYLQSYVDDTLVGFNYGLQLLNYLIAGYLPSHYFPDKYFILDWLRNQQPALTNPVIVYRLYGSASSLLGSFYSDGGIVGVALLSAAWGYLSRKIESMTTLQAPLLVRALGVCWVGMLWMIWGRGDFWALDYMSTAAIPAVALWLVTPKVKRARRILARPRPREEHSVAG